MEGLTCDLNARTIFGGRRPFPYFKCFVTKGFHPGIVQGVITKDKLPRGCLNRLGATLIGTLGKVDFFSAATAYVGFVKFVRKDFLFLTTVRAFADKRF
jgi:hypothetical protein